MARIQILQKSLELAEAFKRELEARKAEAEARVAELEPKYADLVSQLGDNLITQEEFDEVVRRVNALAKPAPAQDNGESAPPEPSPVP